MNFSLNLFRFFPLFCKAVSRDCELFHTTHVFKVSKLYASLWRRESSNWSLDAYKLEFGSEFFSEIALRLVLLGSISQFFSKTSLMRLVRRAPQFSFTWERLVISDDAVKPPKSVINARRFSRPVKLNYAPFRALSDATFISQVAATR